MTWATWQDRLGFGNRLHDIDVVDLRSLAFDQVMSVVIRLLKNQFPVRLRPRSHTDRAMVAFGLLNRDFERELVLLLNFLAFDRQIDHTCRALLDRDHLLLVEACLH